MGKPQRPGAVLITGTSTGIGRTCALHLATRGWQVFATVRKAQDATSLAAEASGQLTPLLLDVTDVAQVQAAVAQVGEAVGEAGLAGLVNNAGVGFGGPLEFVPLDDLRDLFAVNVFGLLAVTQAFLPLIRQGGGRIVNISSTAALVTAPFHGPYTASKATLRPISEALRLELRPWRIHVANVLCGTIDTPIWQKGGGWTQSLEDRYPPSKNELYGTAHRRMGAIFGEMGRRGIPPARAAQVVMHALTARRPRPQYFVGMDTRLYAMLMLLPSRLREHLVARRFGL